MIEFKKMTPEEFADFQKTMDNKKARVSISANINPVYTFPAVLLGTMKALALTTPAFAMLGLFPWWLLGAAVAYALVGALLWAILTFAMSTVLAIGLWLVMFVWDILVWISYLLVPKKTDKK